MHEEPLQEAQSANRPSSTGLGARIYDRMDVRAVHCGMIAVCMAISRKRGGDFQLSAAQYFPSVALHHPK